MLRRLFRLLVVLSVLAIIAVAAVFIVTNTDFGRERARRMLVGILGGQTHGIVKVGAMHGNLLTGATLTAVSITDSTGNPFLKADSISLRYVLKSFLAKHLDFTDVVVYRPDVVIARLPDKVWNYRILWPSKPKTPGVESPKGWGDWVTLTNATVINGHVTVRSPWSPRSGVSAHIRDSLITDALAAGSRLHIERAPGGFQKVVTLEKLNAKLPFLRWADPNLPTRLAKVAAMSMDAYPFRPPAAEVRALTGNFEFNDDSLWWKGAAVRLPASALKGDGVYVMTNGDMRLTSSAAPAAFHDFRWLYARMPADGGGTGVMSIQWKGATQDYVIRNADVRTGRAHVLGDVGVTMTDTVFFHDANLRFTGLTTKLIESLATSVQSPRQGELAGRAKFSGTAKRLLLDADVDFVAYGRGTSSVAARGVVGIEGKPVVVSARDLHVHVKPLQIDIVKLLFPTLPINGTLSGTTTLNGSGSSQLVATALDIVHRDGPNMSHAVGRGSFHTTGRQTVDVDVQTRPVSLAEISKFAPALGLKGVATGPAHFHGPIDAMRVDTKLALAGGAQFGLSGTVDFKSKELGYNVVADATALDLSRVMVSGPRTSLNGGGHFAGRGFKPATMYADIDLRMGSSSFDTLSIDSATVRARLANGLATIERAHVGGAGATADISGTLGLDANHAGTLTYAVALDSLGTFARFIPGGAGADTGIVAPRPLIAAEALRRARADSATAARHSEVARAILGKAPAPTRIPTDTPTSIPRSVLAGSLKAQGTVAGSIARFSLQGTANASGLVVRGNAARHLDATYSWIDARTKSSKLTAGVRADSVSAFGFAFDSLATDVSYLAPSGTLDFRVRQGDQRDYAINGDFTIHEEHNEVHVSGVTLRFDTTAWRTTRPSTVRWGAKGIEVLNLELRNGDRRRIFANGLLPTKGTANFDLQVTEFPVENVAALLQSDLPATGLLSLDAHVAGTAEDPRMSGRLDFVHGTYNETPVPEVHGTFAYANQRLTTNATAVDSTGRLLASVNGTIPIDLALSGVTGSRLLDLPMKVALVSDSLPIELIPQFTTAVTDVKGRALGSVAITGTLKQPRLQGDLTLSDAQFRVSASGTFLEHVNGRVRMTGDSVFVDSIAGDAGGRVRVAGTIGVGNWRVPNFNLFLTALDAELLDNDQGKIYANAGIRVAGPLDSVYATGQVTVTHGVIYIPEGKGKKVIGAGDPQLFAVVDTSLATNRDLFPSKNNMFRNLRVDVDLAVERNTWVRSRDANVEVYTDGPMRVAVVGDALTLTGAIDADRGEYTFLGKRFQIKRGSALFIGSPDLNPTLQITAEYVVKQATGVTNIRVLIGGTVEAPRISLESDAQPPLSQSDLLSYLAFGESTRSVQGNLTSLSGGGSGGGGGNLLNVASSRLAGVAIGEVLNDLEGNATRSLGLDVFNVTPGDLPVFANQSGLAGFLAGTEFELGKYLSPSTFVSVIATPGSLSLVPSPNRAPPGVSLTHRTAHGYRFETSYTPYYILHEPTLAGQTYSPTGKFGAFVIREWRF